MKKVFNIIFLVIIGLILLTVLAFWFTDTIIRPSTAVLLVVVLAVAVIVKNRVAKNTEEKEE
ncbi:hypothetical protein GCM10007275_04740 [Jeotgalicoccus coquinae]|uniref:Membrane protein YqjE n=1 Tax=Jeotgalicoccus coquinae TaxID=709509 RepID=A0A6V7RA85_9STAP|nr:hypothetical protein [Jeotgalicoccus coquinae]MBB6422859.1 putative membrane protein YqjE [Jeotgalicoccus coquinae]GGE12606.1 hypothetical protein GCM10007275_04740 [Jeotgalicoccus coquinae]CAD2073884.1 hypothetical protein JEOCOQ751_00821 [Jeotgalicoccus coquinae]